MLSFNRVMKILESQTVELFGGFRVCQMNMKDENVRSSVPEMFFEKGVLRNFAKIKGKHLCQSLFSRKLQASSLKYHLLAAGIEV